MNARSVVKCTIQPELLMTIDQVDLVDSRAWLTSELWSSDFKIMVKYSGPSGFYTEIGRDNKL